VDSVLMGNDTAQQIAVRRALYTASLSGPGGDNTSVQPISDQDLMAIPPNAIADVLLYPAFTFQSDGLQAILPFCDGVETLNFTSSPTSQGFFATQGVNASFNAFIVAISEMDKSGFSDGQDASDALSWEWQYCSQFGYFQVADPDNPVNIVSTYISVADELAWCDQTFNNQNPPQPDVTALNKYGGWNMSPSNVFFSNGEYDPWRTLSVNSQESNSPQRNGSETVPTCNTSPQFPSFFGTTYPQQVHGADVFMSSRYPQGDRDAFAKGGALFGSALDQWLPCYTPAPCTDGGNNIGSLRMSSGERSSSRLFFLASTLSGLLLLYILA